jgi:hypothetical protein
VWPGRAKALVETALEASLEDLAARLSQNR